MINLPANHTESERSQVLIADNQETEFSIVSESSKAAAPVSPVTYWSEVALTLSTQRDKCRILIFETIFVGAASLFFYFVAFSPPSRPFNIVDLFIVVVVGACTQTVVAYYWNLARKLRWQLDDAIKEASRCIDQEHRPVRKERKS